jgi:hypothetical protein
MRFSPLRFAAEEGRAVAHKLPGAVLLTGSAATEDAVKALGGPLLLHIATHGFFLPDLPALHAPASMDPDARREGLGGWEPPPRRVENPLVRAGLALAGANNHRHGHEDGVLTALELSQVDLMGTKLVVLSACQTGVGAYRFGDGVYGLRRAVAMAGAEAQVMSLWSVDDAATSELMQSYYDHLLAGGGRSEALRQAQLAMLNRPDRAHPYYWASFIVSGNPAALDGIISCRPSQTETPPASHVSPDSGAPPGQPSSLAVRLFADDVSLKKGLPLSLSVETLGGVSTMLIPRGTGLPAVRREMFSTATDNQTSIDVHVLVGDRTLAVDNVTVGKFSIIDVPPAPRGAPRFEVELAIDDHGTFRFSAKDRARGKPQPVSSAGSLSNPLSQPRVGRMLDDAKAEEAKGEYGIAKATPGCWKRIRYLNGLQPS